MKAFINYYESLSCAGNTDALMDAVYSGKSAISLDNSYIKERFVGIGKMKGDDFFHSLEDVVTQVLKKSNLENYHNTLLIVGSSVGGMQESEKHYFQDKNYKNIDPAKHGIGVIQEYLQKQFHFLDTRSLSTACTSSANALLLAKRMINVGAYQNILVLGADALCYTTACGFSSLGILSSKACKPFDKNREGMNVAEAVASLLIQDTKNENSIELIGVGASSDAYHMTNPDPEAKGAIASMKKALEDAGLKPNDIDYINAHGTGTIANDAVEALAIETLFHATDAGVSSTKAITGHTLGAAGALEAIISCEVIKHQKIPLQAGLENQENQNINILKKSVQKNVRYVLSNSFAFGGNNTSLVFGTVL